MWNTDAPAHYVPDCEYLVDFIRGHTQLVAPIEMVFDTIVTSQDKGSDKPKHFLGFGRECSVFVCLIVEAEKAIDDFVILRQNFSIHFLAVGIEFFLL